MTHTTDPDIKAHLGPAHADDAVNVAVGIVEEGHGDGMLAGGDPVPLCVWVNLENMGPGAEDRLLPAGGCGQDEEECKNVKVQALRMVC